MKVDVIQASDATFRRWQWWSDWIDIAVINYEYRPYLVQMRVSRTNAKQFTTSCITGLLYRQATCGDIGDLTSMNKEGRSNG